MRLECMNVALWQIIHDVQGKEARVGTDVKDDGATIPWHWRKHRQGIHRFNEHALVYPQIRACSQTSDHPRSGAQVQRGHTHQHITRVRRQSLQC